MHRVLMREVVIDAPSETFDASRRFWADALAAGDREVGGHPEFVALDDPAALCAVGLQRIGHGPARLHLDIESSDVEAEVARLVGLGAVVLERVRTWVVMQDPSGLRFCVVEPESVDFESRSRAVG